MDSFEYSFSPQTPTCKDRWEFRVRDGRIESIHIAGKDGCKGHPRTIEVLLKGMELEGIDLDALAAAECARERSCGQTLADALREMKTRMEGAK